MFSSSDFEIWDDRSKAGIDFSTIFCCQKKAKIHQIFDLLENGSKSKKKTMFNKIELFRIEDPSILVGDCYDLHFGHNQDEQER